MRFSVLAGTHDFFCGKTRFLIFAGKWDFFRVLREWNFPILTDLFLFIRESEIFSVFVRKHDYFFWRENMIFLVLEGKHDFWVLWEKVIFGFSGKMQFF